MRFIYNPVRAYSQQCQDPAPATATTMVRKRWYMGDFEIFQKLAPASKTYQLHYINSDAGLVGIVVEESGSYQYYAAYTDHLGSIVTLTNDAGVVVAKQSYDAWGRERNPDTWDYGATLSAGGSTIPTPPEWLYRGYTGHEMLPEYGLINMNARLYDPITGRMLRPDNLVSDPLNSQSYNRFSYANNNPLTFIDPDGNFPVAAVIIGVAFGMYTGGSMANGGQLNPLKWDPSGRTWTYMAAGGLVGGFSGGLGAQIAQGGGFMANTMGIVFSSYTNSLGTALYTGGRSGMNVTFGIASYNFTNGDVGYLGEGGNKWYQNLGYLMGGLANLQDAVAGFNGVNAQYKAEHGEVDHARLTGTYNDGKVDNPIDISIAHDPAPAGAYKYNGTNQKIANLDYARYWWRHITEGKYYAHTQKAAPPLPLNNVNGKWLATMTARSQEGKGLWGIGGLKYGITMFGCQSHVAHALLGVGVPTLPINFHPLILYGQLALRQGGIFASPYLTNLTR